MFSNIKLLVYYPMPTKCILTKQLKEFVICFVLNLVYITINCILLNKPDDLKYDLIGIHTIILNKESFVQLHSENVSLV